LQRLTNLIFWILRLISLGFLAMAAFLAYTRYEAFQMATGLYPPGSQAAETPIGGLSREEAAARLTETYSTPLTLTYAGQPILLSPADAGFQLDLEAMLPGPDLQSDPLDWVAFRDFLWERAAPAQEFPLIAHHSPDAIRAFLEKEIAPRYDLPATHGGPRFGTTEFYAGTAGRALDVEAALPLIEKALYTLEARSVGLPIRPVPPSPPSWESLDLLLHEVIPASGFDGLTGVYVSDLSQERHLHFALQGNRPVAVEPDIAFTASSIIKIPILISVFQRLDAPPGPELDRLLRLMIAESSNEAADAVMKTALDEVRGPLLVTEDMQELGLENTFLAGYFALGSPLLQLFETPANRRADISTDPDIYSQTTLSDIGRLLEMIERCAKTGSGPLQEAFGPTITQTECQSILDYLHQDHIPYMLMAGLPEGTPLAHKHGFASYQGTIHSIGDAGIISSPGGDFVLVVWMYHPDQLLWDDANALIARVAQTVYHFFNLPQDSSP